MKSVLKLVFVVFNLLILIVPRGLHGASVSVAADFNPASNGTYPTGLLQGKDGYLYGVAEFGGTFGAGTFFRTDHAGHFTLLTSFNSSTGGQPILLSEGSAGGFYGTAQTGGAYGDGTIFHGSPSNGQVNALFSPDFLSAGSPGPLAQGADGNFYGLTTAGIQHAFTFFRLTPSGAYKSLGQFSTATYGIANLPLARGTDNNFYGTTYSTVAGQNGSVFRLTPAGVLTVIGTFNGANGSTPVANLTLDGSLFYGVTASGGPANAGTIYSVATSGSITLLHSFDGTVAKSPQTGLFLGPDGFLYGTTSKNGNPGTGPVYKVSTTGGYSIVRPDAGISITTLGSDGNFYGTGGELNGAAGALEKMTPGGTLTTIFSFGGSGLSSPNSIVQASDGTIYGTTQDSVYKFSTTGTLSALASFAALNWRYVNPGLTIGPDNNLYGSTYLDAGGTGYGQIYRVTPTGSITPIYTFGAPSATNGAYPNPGLALAKDGNFYGTTSQGGSANVGTVFKVSTSGSLTTFASLPSTLPGMGIMSPLVQGPTGTFYGSDAFYNASNQPIGDFFKVTSTGAVTKFAYFTPSVGSWPSGLMFGNDSNLYLTAKGPTDPSIGVFKLTIAGSLTTVGSSSSTTSGVFFAPLEDANGNFFGTSEGTVDPDDYGSFFMVAPGGTFTTIAQIDQYGPSSPQAPMIKGADGYYYGVAGGGQSGQGTIFRLNPSPYFFAHFTSAATVPLVTSNFIPGNTALVIDLGTYYPTVGTFLTVVETDGLGPINGTFNNLPDGGSITILSHSYYYTFQANYRGGSGNNLTLQVTSVVSSYPVGPGGG